MSRSYGYIGDNEGRDRSGRGDAHMSGIFYDPKERRLRTVQGTPEAEWTLVTHNLNAKPHQCRRIMREWLTADEIWLVDCQAVEAEAQANVRAS